MKLELDREKLEFTQWRLVPAAFNQVIVAKGRVSILWEDVRGIEEFTNNGIFQQGNTGDHQETISRTVIVTVNAAGGFIAEGHYNDFNQAWDEYLKYAAQFRNPLFRLQ